MPKIDLKNAPSGSGSSYPPPFDEPCRGRSWHRLGVAAGLTHLGVNLVRLAPGAWSSQRHWHTHEDEFVYVLSGELMLVTDAGEEVLVAGDSAGHAGTRPCRVAAGDPAVLRRGCDPRPSHHFSAEYRAGL